MGDFHVDHFVYRQKSVAQLTNEVGCYILADLDNVPLYVGQSVDGIKSRVRRHLTSARSDIIANRQIDVWEIAFVWSYPVDDAEKIGNLEALLFHTYDKKSQLMNGSIPPIPSSLGTPPDAAQIVQVISNDDLKERLSPETRLPRQAQHYANLVDQFLVVKRSDQIARSMEAHFERLSRYHKNLMET